MIDVECKYCNDQGCDVCEEIYVDDEFSDNEDEGMKEMLGQNMKFNIIFTVGQPLGAEEYYEDEEYNELEESEYDEDDIEEDDIRVEYTVAFAPIKALIGKIDSDYKEVGYTEDSDSHYSKYKRSIELFTNEYEI